MAAQETCAAMSLSAEDEVGPYYLDDRLFRNNITENEVGIPVTFIVSVVDTSCSPVADAYVDIWHCNSTGYYSGYLGKATPATQASSSHVVNLCNLQTFHPHGDETSQSRFRLEKVTRKACSIISRT